MIFKVCIIKTQYIYPPFSINYCIFIYSKSIYASSTQSSLPYHYIIAILSRLPSYQFKKLFNKSFTQTLFLSRHNQLFNQNLHHNTKIDYPPPPNSQTPKLLIKYKRQTTHFKYICLQVWDYVVFRATVLKNYQH